MEKGIKIKGLIAKLKNKRVFIAKHPEIKDGIVIQITGLYNKKLEGTTNTISEETHFKKHRAVSGICVTREVFMAILQAGVSFLEEEEKEKFLNKLN